jgi:hypothetical protein
VIGLVRSAEVVVEIDGKPLTLSCAPYVLPREVDGLRIQADTTSDWLDMPRRVQFSLWDATERIVDTRTFCFPLPDYRLLSHGIQAYNEPVHLGHRDGDPAGQRFYHNYGVDLAGYERRQKVVSAIEGVVVQARDKDGTLTIRDDRGLADVDFCKVKVFSDPTPEDVIPTLFVTYHPAEAVRVGEPVRFRIWPQGGPAKAIRVDFGDGRVLEDYRPYSEITHRYAKSGIHVVTVSAVAEGLPVTQKVKVFVPSQRGGARP